LTRIRIVLLLSALLALATGLAACGGDDGGSDAEEVVESATLEGIESGKIDLSLDVSSSGERSGNLKITASGPFQAGGEGELPQLAIAATAKGKVDGDNVDFKGGLTLLSDRAFIEYDGNVYEVDPTTFGFVKSGLEQAEQSPESSGDVTACQDAATGLDLASLIADPQDEGSAEVDGQETTKIGGRLDVGGAADAVIALTEDPACGAQLEAAGELPLDELEDAKGEVTDAVKKADVELYVGDDGIVRRVVADLDVTPADGGRVTASLDLTLSAVNQEQEIPTPTATRQLEDLFGDLEINPTELLEGGTGGITGTLEGLLDSDDSKGGGSSGGGSSGGGSSGGSGSGGSVDADQQQAYLKCLQEVETASDLQDCASLAP